MNHGNAGRGQGHVRVGAEGRVMFLQAKGCKVGTEPPEARKEAWGGAASALPEKPPFQTPSLQNHESQWFQATKFFFFFFFVICHGTLRKLTQMFPNQMSVRKAAYSPTVATNPDQHISN